MKKIARVYCRVSTQEQNLERQIALKSWAEQQGFYVAKIYAEKASGRHADRPKLKEMLEDLQHGETVIAENIDRLSRMPLKEAEALISKIKSKGAKILLPGSLEMSDGIYEDGSMAAVVFEGIQNFILSILLKSASDDYELRRERQAVGIKRAQSEGIRCFGRRVSQKRIDDVSKCRDRGLSIAETARVLGCSISTVKRIRQKLKQGHYKSSNA